MFAAFLSDEAGAITVDWVVLTASIVGLSIAVIALIQAAAESPTNALNSSVQSDIIATEF